MNFDKEIRCHRYPVAAFLNVDGADAATFLQGQFSNDLGNVAAGASVYGLWLDRKGKVLGDSTVIRRPDGAGFWIVSLGYPAAGLAQHLADHVIADEVEIRDETAAWGGVAVLGPGSGDAVTAVPGIGARFPGRRSAGESWEWVFPLAAAAQVDAALAGAPEVGAAEMELLRIRAGLAGVPGDIGPADLPNEGGLDQVAISYSKGCYLGQEVMARVKAMGRIRRTLVRVSGHFAAPPVPAALWRGAARAGELRSVVAVGEGSEGLALISVDAAAAQEPLALVSGGPPVVTVHTR